jgi:uncharacterized phage infection (PIP) family protein YhgE
MEITAEIQAAIDAAVENATSGLKTKNAELLGELKKARKAGEITPDQIAAVEAERDELQTKLAEAMKSTSKTTKELDTLRKALETEQKTMQTLLVENGLTEALTKSGVTNPAYLKAAKTLLGAQAQLVQDGDHRIAKIGDKPLSDFVSEWASGEEGKHFVAAPGNTGGGANGGNGGGASAVKGKVDGDPAERAAYFAQKFPDLKTA